MRARKKKWTTRSVPKRRCLWNLLTNICLYYNVSFLWKSSLMFSISLMFILSKANVQQWYQNYTSVLTLTTEAWLVLQAWSFPFFYKIKVQPFYSQCSAAISKLCNCTYSYNRRLISSTSMELSVFEVVSQMTLGNFAQSEWTFPM